MTEAASHWQHRLKAIIYVWVVAALCLTAISPAALAQSQRQYIQNIYLSGFKCVKLNPDSFLNGASSNEIFFVIVSNAPESSGINASSTGTFNGVKAGFGRKARNRIWSGVQQPLSLRVAMFERDAGGATGQVVAKAMVTALVAAGGKAGNARGSASNPGSSRLANAAGSSEIPNRNGSVLREDEKAEPGFVAQLGRGVTNTFGLSHDLLGYDRQIFGRSDWSSKPTYQERDIRYHFHTNHRANGVNCRAYFLIERGAEVNQPQRAPEPNRIAQAPRPSEYAEPNLGPYQGPVPDPYRQPGPDEPQGPPPYEELPPPPPPPVYVPPPPPPEPDWFRVRFKNSCDVPISMSYVYNNPSRGWVKRGWANFDPGESAAMEGNTLTPEIFIYTSKGRVAGSFDPEVINLSVRKEGFDVDHDTSFRGDQGARLVPYSVHVLSDISGTELVAIRDCTEWVAGKLLSPQQIADQKQAAWEAQIDKRSRESTNLIVATFHGDIALMRRAIDEGANINIRNYSLGAGITPLHIAAQRFDGAAIDLLLDKGADATRLSNLNETPFISALKSYNDDALFDDFPRQAFARLAKAGADPNQKPKNGSIALERLLSSYTPDSFAKIVANRKKAPKADSDMFSFLAARTQTNLDAVHTNGRYTALHYAAIAGHRPLAEALLKNGANPHIRDATGKFPRDYAEAWSKGFAELFGPMPPPEPAPVVEAEQVTKPQPALAPKPVDPKVLAERCRQLVANGMAKADDCPGSN